MAIYEVDKTVLYQNWLRTGRIIDNAPPAFGRSERRGDRALRQCGTSRIRYFCPEASGFWTFLLHGVGSTSMPEPSRTKFPETQDHRLLILMW